MVFQLISMRYETGAIILTSNKALNEWGGLLGDDVLATAILDSLLHHCDVLAINGSSWRLKDRLTLVTGDEPMPSFRPPTSAHEAVRALAHQVVRRHVG